MSDRISIRHLIRGITLTLLCLVSMLTTSIANATNEGPGLQLASVFTDNMVLQRNEPITIWGSARAGTVVSATFMNERKLAKTQSNGTWRVTFAPQPANGSPQTIEITHQQKKLKLHNILIGDVWLCSGQSNMYFPLSETDRADSVLKKVTSSSSLRLFKYKPFAETDNQAWTNEALTRANDLNFFSGSWKIDDANAAKEFSAVGYIFGKKILERENIPVGLIEIAVGGSPLISWISREALASNPQFAPLLKNWRNSDQIMQWCRERADVNLKNATSTSQKHSYAPSFNFEAGIANLVPLPIKGVIWYQGESDAEHIELYEKLFPVFVKDWRHHWQKNLPVYYVQLSSLERPTWHYFRDAQRRLLNQVENSGMVVTSDLGDRKDVHYKNKIPVGERLAQMALNKTYKRNIIPSGPLFRSLKRREHKIEIVFDHAAGLEPLNDKHLKGFELCTKNGQFIPVPATVKNDRVYITIPKGIDIEKVVYAWQPFTRANLVNKDGLPASTFSEPVK